MDNDAHIGPFNVGNPGEFTMIELAEMVKKVVNPSAEVRGAPPPPGLRALCSGVTEGVVVLWVGGVLCGWLGGCPTGIGCPAPR